MAALARLCGKSYFQCQTSFLQRVCWPSYEFTRDFVASKGDGPAKPVVIKKPPTSFIQFFTEQKPKLELQFPGMKVTELTKQASILYKNLPEADKNALREDYKKRLEEFKTQMKGLSKADIEGMQALRKEKKKVRAKRAKRKLCKELGKPVKMSGYALFAKENLLKGDSLKQVAAKWKTLGQNEKEVYLSRGRELMKDYNEKMKVWEQKMLSEGHPEVVRRRELPKELRAKRRASKVTRRKATKKPKKAKKSKSKTKKAASTKTTKKPKEKLEEK